MEPEPNIPAQDGPLSQHHYDDLALATERAKPIRRAARVATFNGWTMAIIAALSVPFAISGWVALLVAIGLTIVAIVEFRGRNRLLKFDPSAASLLGWNQIGLLTLIVVYCLWMLFGGATDIQAHPELAQLLGRDGLALYRTFVIGFYATVIALTVIFQGGNAFYYFTRRKYIVAYREQTPQWVQDFRDANS
ncbi:hypothetical protein NHH03_23290 [Stieleria sp. TO1_6]|uniref:hypothetical protein n=1 Tax=Stieleria tagensis TaxID=2956795 RepID=UPI00209AA0B2|nr:hypothetical protein [Stieleria tagensis]MCO8124683.1 hypothetical protein [Stieleria tagensis]